jgi:hypothetical protein
MELVKVNPQDYGLTDETAYNISSQFKPMLDKMVELEKEYNEVVQMPIESEETSKAAKQLRMKYVKVRTGTTEIHKQQKAFFLNGGRFVDGWKNAQIFAAQGKEDALERIEKHCEIVEKERQEKLHSVRFNELMPYIDAATIDSTNFPNFGDMDEDVWQAYLTAKKSAYNDRIEAERKAHEERERAKIEEAQIREKLAKEAEARRLAEEKLRKAEKEKMELLKAQREKERQEAAEKAEAEAKAAAEEKARKAAERKAKNAPDKQKLESFAKTLETLRDAMPVMKTEDGQSIATNVHTLMTKIVAYIQKETKDI